MYCTYKDRKAPKYTLKLWVNLYVLIKEYQINYIRKSPHKKCNFQGCNYHDYSLEMQTLI